MIRTFKVLEKIGDKEYVFDTFAFKSNIRQYMADKKDLGVIVKMDDVKGDLAEKTCTSMDAVNNWVYGKNGVSDLQMVKKIAEYLQINYMSLLRAKENKVMAEIVNATTNVNMNNTKDVVRNIFQAFSRFIDKATFTAYGCDSHDSWRECCDLCCEAERVLHSGMLDIPITLYKEFESILQNFKNCLYGENIADVWDTMEYYNYCKENGWEDDRDTKDAFIEYKYEKFYADMQNLLKDYIIA